MENKKMVNSKSKWFSFVASILICFAPTLAFAAGGVNRADQGLNSVNTWMQTIIPICMGIGIMVSYALYTANIVGKEIFQRILVGLIGCGSASWLVSQFM